MITRKITSSFTIPVGWEWERVDNSDGSITVTCWRYAEIKKKYTYKSCPTKRWTDELLADVLKRSTEGVTLKELAKEFDVGVSYMGGIVNRARVVEYKKNWSVKFDEEF